MPTGWFLAQLIRNDRNGRVNRGPLSDAVNAVITADGGAWVAAECLGGYAVLKVSASAATLNAVAAEANVQRIPVARLDDPLSTLTLAQRQAIRVKLGVLGYTAQEIQTRFGAGTDLSGVTLGDVLRFALTRRLRPRYDQATNSIINDGPQDPTEDVSVLDTRLP